ncbi:YggS family pyridoxal phosphate-dependent enzyme [Bacteroidota bacterium]
MSISDNLLKLRSEIPDEVSIVAVSKRKSVEDILEAYNEGQRVFGENRVQELIEKQPRLPGDIQWHMVGHLQTNKVKYLAGFTEMIHSADSLKLLQAISREASKAGRTISCLLQIHIASEESKFGFSKEEVLDLTEDPDFQSLTNIRIAGVMGMATFTEDMDRVRSEFRYLRGVFEDLKEKYFTEDQGFLEISMGMSGDYKVAIEEGSTMIRLGTVIFGPRNY